MPPLAGDRAQFADASAIQAVICTRFFSMRDSARFSLSVFKACLNPLQNPFERFAVSNSR
jgi:hypothetical protein